MKKSVVRRKIASPKKHRNNKTYVVTIQTYFVRTNPSDEPNPSQKTLNKIFKERVVEDLKTWYIDEPMGYHRNNPAKYYYPISSYKNFKAHRGGKITFEVSDVDKTTMDKLMEVIKNQNLWTSEPGLGMAVATLDGEDMLGEFDFRDKVTYKLKK